MGKPHITVFENHKKVSLNIASEASYVYILSDQNLIKNAKNGAFWRGFENLKLAVRQCYQILCQILEERCLLPSSLGVETQKLKCILKWFFVVYQHIFQPKKMEEKRIA